MDLQFSIIQNDADKISAAILMSNSEPWITLKRNYNQSLTLINDPELEVHFVRFNNQFAGFSVIKMNGAFIGYIQSIVIAPKFRNLGIGAKFISYLENRIFTDHPNVFICASSFNPKAMKLYKELGYNVVGELKDYIIKGHSETLMRKSISPISTY